MKSPATDAPAGGGLWQAARSPQVQLVTPAQPGRFEALLAQKHYLGTLPSVGDFLGQVVVREGQWVALLVWRPAALKLKDCERWIGWNPALAAERLKLLVQNRRHLLLHEKGAEPNLASAALHVRGLLLPWERKSLEPMAERLGIDSQRLQQFVADSPWADQTVRQAIRREVVPTLEPLTAWIVAETGWLKQGQKSVGVAHQYCGAEGKQANCQVSVEVVVSDGELAAPVAGRLYLPEKWATQQVWKPALHGPSAGAPDGAQAVPARSRSERGDRTGVKEARKKLAGGEAQRSHRNRDPVRFRRHPHVQFLHRHPRPHSLPTPPRQRGP